MLRINSSIHHYDTHISNSFHLFKVNSNLTKNSVRFNFPVIWNSIIPDNIKSL